MAIAKRLDRGVVVYCQQKKNRKHRPKVKIRKEPISLSINITFNDISP